MALHRDAIGALQDWKPAPECESDWRDTRELLRRGPQVMRREHDERHITGSAIIVSADGERVLLCLHGRFNLWVQLGGHCEPDDATMHGVALREATEESGIAGLTVDPVPIDLSVHPVNCAGRASLHYDVVYAVYAPQGAVERVSPESHALGWFTPDALPHPLGSHVERMARAALARAADRQLDIRELS